MKRILSALLFAVLALVPPANAQTGPSTNGPFFNPNWYDGYVPTAFQWGLLWSNKMDYFPGGVPIIYGGTGATSAAQALANLGGTTSVLPTNDIFVGNASNAATAVAMSGDCGIVAIGTVTCTKTNGVAFGYFATGTAAANLTGPLPAISGAALTNLNASALASGTVPSGVVAGSYTGITGVGTITAGTWDGTIITPTFGGTGSNLSATGGTSQVLQQTSTGGNVTVGQLACGSLSNSQPSCSTDATNATNITSGTLPSGRISGTYSGLTGVGTITTGTWTGTTVAVANGGTGTTTSTGTGSVVLGTAPSISNPTFTGGGTFGTPTTINLTNATAVPAAQLSGNVPIANLASGTGATVSTFLRGDNSWAAPAASLIVGSSGITSGTTNGLLYDNAGTLGNLATANSALLVTSSGGVPSISTTIPNGVTATTQGLNDNSTKVASTSFASTLYRNYIGGCTMSNDVTSPNTVLDVSACNAMDSGNTVMVVAGAFTKSTAGAWASGSGSNGMGNGLTIAASTWYDVCLAYNNGVPDYWFDTSNRSTTYAECTNKPSGITGTTHRRVGSVYSNASSHIQLFSQFFEGKIRWVAPITTSGIFSNGVATAIPGANPTGFYVNLILDGYFLGTNTGWGAAIRSPIVTVAPDNYQWTGAGNSPQQGTHVELFTNTSGQVILDFSGLAGNGVYVTGYDDPRGQ